MRVAVDIGGTFTDLVVVDAEGLRTVKTLRTPDDHTRGIREGLARLGFDLAALTRFVHGSTIAINTVIERKGARTGLIATAGFRDVYEIGRINRPDAYNLFFRKHVPLVDRSSRHEVHERLLASGAVHKPLDEDHLRSVLRSLKPQAVESVAILLLHSYRNPAH